MKLKTLLTCSFLITQGSTTKLSRFDEGDEDGDFLSNVAATVGVFTGAAVIGKASG